VEVTEETGIDVDLLDTTTGLLDETMMIDDRLTEAVGDTMTGEVVEATEAHLPDETMTTGTETTLLDEPMTIETIDADETTLLLPAEGAQSPLLVTITGRYQAATVQASYYTWKTACKVYETDEG
jgi:hypothetical protein